MAGDEMNPRSEQDYLRRIEEITRAPSERGIEELVAMRGVSKSW